jgi:hypothetical protein
MGKIIDAARIYVECEVLHMEVRPDTAIRTPFHRNRYCALSVSSLAQRVPLDSLQVPPAGRRVAGVKPNWPRRNDVQLWSYLGSTATPAVQTLRLLIDRPVFKEIELSLSLPIEPIVVFQSEFD